MADVISMVENSNIGEHSCSAAQFPPDYNTVKDMKPNGGGGFYATTFEMVDKGQISIEMTKYSAEPNETAAVSEATNMKTDSAILANPNLEEIYENKLSLFKFIRIIVWTLLCVAALVYGLYRVYSIFFFFIKFKSFNLTLPLPLAWLGLGAICEPRPKFFWSKRQFR